MRYLLHFLAVLSLFLLSCSSIDNRLYEIESIMDENPDSALFILERIDIGSLQGDENHALYSLLLTQARDKNYFFEKNDSIIKIACDYYDGTKDYLRIVQSHFYMANINYYSKKYTNAIYECLKAENELPKIDNHYWKAKVYELHADIYYENFYIDAAVTYRKMAIAEYRAAEKLANEIYATIDMALCYDRGEKIDSSIIILDGLKNKISPFDSVCYAFYHSSYIKSLTLLDRNEEAYSHFTESKRYWKILPEPYKNYPNIAVMFMNLNMQDSAYFYLDKHLKTKGIYDDSENYYTSLARYYRKEQKFDKALDAYINKMLIHNSAFTYTIKRNVSEASKDFYVLKSNIDANRAEKYNIIMISIIIVSILLALLFIIYYSMKMKQKKIEIEQRMYEIIQLNNDVASFQSQIGTLQDVISENENKISNISSELSHQNDLIEKLFHERFAELNKFSHDYFLKKDCEKLRHTILSDFEKVYQTIKSDDYMAKLKQIVNECRCNILSKIREQMPKFKETDITFIALYLAGFSPGAICMIMDITISNYYDKKRRLRLRIESSEAIDKDFFLKSLDDVKK